MWKVTVGGKWLDIQILPKNVPSEIGSLPGFLFDICKTSLKIYFKPNKHEFYLFKREREREREVDRKEREKTREKER